MATKKQELPSSLRNKVKEFNKKAIILLVLLLCLTMTSGFFINNSLNTSYQTSIIEIQKGYEQDIVNQYIGKIEKKGYEKVFCVKKEKFKNEKRFYNQLPQQDVIEKYNCFSEYYSFVYNKKQYLFKNIGDWEDFVKQVKKYKKIKQTKIVRNIGLEAEKTEINQVIKKIKKTKNSSKKIKKVSHDIKKLQEYAYNLVINKYNWTEEDFNALVKLWNRESGWDPNTHNKKSGAHGIPQSLPASKMKSEGADYYTNGETQIRWGLKYIKKRYGSPSKAWTHSQRKGWY